MFLYFNTIFGRIDIILNEIHKSIEIPKQSERLIFEIEDTLKKNELNYSDVIFSTISGPGNFTNIKTNLAVAKAIKLATKNNLIVSNLFEIIGFDEDYDYLTIKINPQKYYIKDKNDNYSIAENIDNLQGKILSEFSDKKWKQITKYKFENRIFNEFEPMYVESASISIRK
ncbi:MAG: hypothetical protein LBH46_03135 [Rickettsiales bacterium]|jgi:tRNA A37 threonylcarbamoyladenosine modification protein TsaB|nr:hypothetical protein [Rickettsiales bacterium]